MIPSIVVKCREGRDGVKSGVVREYPQGRQSRRNVNPGTRAINGPYGSHDLAGLGRRTRLDRGMLGAVALSAATTREAVGLPRRAKKRGLVQRTAAEVVVDALPARTVPTRIGDSASPHLADLLSACEGERPDEDRGDRQSSPQIASEGVADGAFRRLTQSVDRLVSEKL